jgi:Protein of unknown function (DUF2892)
MNNIEIWERVVRIVVGVALLSMLGLLDSNWKWVGLVGLIPLTTGIIGWCPIYAWYAQD